MPSSLRIIGWKATGLRCPDHELNFCDRSGFPFKTTLIQMPNGTGKTTTLALVRAILSGTADRWNSKDISEFRKENSSKCDGYFELRLTLDQNRLTFILKFDFELNSVHFQTTWKSGVNDGFRPPYRINRVMSEDFVNFYVFDGELANNLLNKEKTDAEQAVESLFRIQLLKEMSNQIQKFWDFKTFDSTARDKAALTRRMNLLTQWRTRREELEKEKGELEKKYISLETEQRNLQNSVEKEIQKQEKFTKDFDSTKSRKVDLERKIEIISIEILDAMRDPHALSIDFAEEIYEFKSRLDTVKLPETASREFFEELAKQEKECICGRPIDEEISKVIRERAKRYLGSDDVITLNAIKTDISDALEESQKRAVQELTVSIDELATLMSHQKATENDLDYIESQVAKENPQVEDKKNRILVLSSELAQISSKLGRFKEKDYENLANIINKVDIKRIYSLETIKEGVKLLEERVEEATENLNLLEKRNSLTFIIDKAYKIAKVAVRNQIQAKANEVIGELMPHNKIRIEKIDQCLYLEGKSGGSSGENLSVAYAFLSTLFARSNQYDLPFVVDSPANPIDKEIRPRIGELVPKLTNQFLAFVISTERDRFVPSLSSASNGDIQYITLFRKGTNKFVKLPKSCPSSITFETEDGIQVIGEKFFSDFQDDTEED